MYFELPASVCIIRVSGQSNLPVATLNKKKRDENSKETWCECKEEGVNSPLLCFRATCAENSVRVSPLFLFLGLAQELLHLNRLSGVTTLDGGKDQGDRLQVGLDVGLHRRTAVQPVQELGN